MAKKKGRKGRRSRILRPRETLPGTPPGVLEAVPGATPAHLRAIGYGPTTVEEHADITLDGIRQLRGKHPVLWVDVDGVDDVPTLQKVGEIFSLHPLAIEDAAHVHQRPKVDEYDDSVFIAVRLPTSTTSLVLTQLAIFIGPDFVVTVQEKREDHLEPIVQRLLRARGRIRGVGADFLGYAILDAVIDHYFPLVERLGERLEEIESEVLASTRIDPTSEVHSIRQDLHLLRRVLAASREAISQLGRMEDAPASDEVRVFLRDCHDHTSQLLDALDACRDLSGSLMELYASSLNTRTTEVITLLTMISTIFIPLSFIVGLYGMNFDFGSSPYNMPELHWRYGYPFALGLMAVTATALFVFFRTRGWLGGSKPKHAPSPPPNGAAENGARDPGGR